MTPRDKRSVQLAGTSLGVLMVSCVTRCSNLSDTNQVIIQSVCAATCVVCMVLQFKNYVGPNE